MFNLQSYKITKIHEYFPNRECNYQQLVWIIELSVLMDLSCLFKGLGIFIFFDKLESFSNFKILCLLYICSDECNFFVTVPFPQISLNSSSLVTYNTFFHIFKYSVIQWLKCEFKWSQSIPICVKYNVQNPQLWYHFGI